MLNLTKKMFSAALIVGVFSVGVNFAGSNSIAAAQEKLPVASAAIVDVNSILNKSDSWKNAEKEMKARIGDVQKEIIVKGEALKIKADELKRQQTILSPDVFQQKAREIQVQQRSLQREAQISSAKVNEVLNKMRGQLRAVIVKIAAKVASEKKMNIGFDRANVIFFNDGMDITDEVLKRFNASKTQVEITVDKKQ